MGVRVAYRAGKFLCRTSFDSRDIPRKAGFRFDTESGIWYTPSYQVAARLRDHADDPTKNKIDQKIISISPWDGPLLFPPNEEPKYFQPDAALFALSRNRSYLGLDPGLGKTPIAVMIANALTDRGPSFFVYVSPPFLTRNVVEEFNRWRTFEAKIAIYGRVVDHSANILIVPDSLLHNGEHFDEVSWFIEKAKTRKEKVILFVDEAHRFKNAEAERTKALFGYRRAVAEKSNRQVQGLADFADRIVYMSGTPMPNRPMELYPILSHSAPETIDFMNRFDYGRRYCAGHDTGFGWDFNGASNVEELAQKVKGKFMLRLRKSLLDLPPKTEEMLIVSSDMSPRLAGLNRELLNRYSPEDLMQAAIAKKLFEQEGKEEMHLATYRRLLGEEKVGSTVDIVKSILEETEESVLVFAQHTDVINGLETKLSRYRPAVITGQTPMAKRHEIVKDFQSKTGPRIFIGNIQAAGVGFTLTKATRVIFAEFSWVPAENDQASDRAHRIGQKGSVHVQYLVYQNSVDKAVLETVLRKRKTTEKM